MIRTALFVVALALLGIAVALSGCGDNLPPGAELVGAADPHDAGVGGE